MDYYQLSYDVHGTDRDPTRNDKALESLICDLKLKLAASCVYRPARSTIAFLTSKDRVTVSQAMDAWAVRENVSYFLSQVQTAGIAPDGREKFFFWNRPDSSLQQKVVDLMKKTPPAVSKA